MTVPRDNKCHAGLRRLTTAGFHRPQHDELRIAGDVFAITEQPLQLVEVVQMAVANDPQLSAYCQTAARIEEHLPGDIIGNRLLLMERRIAQHQIQLGRRLLGQAVAGAIDPSAFSATQSVGNPT